MSALLARARGGRPAPEKPASTKELLARAGGSRVDRLLNQSVPCAPKPTAVPLGPVYTSSRTLRATGGQ